MQRSHPLGPGSARRRAATGRESASHAGAPVCLTMDMIGRHRWGRVAAEIGSMVNGIEMRTRSRRP